MLAERPLAHTDLRRDGPPVALSVSHRLVDYETATARMDAVVEALRAKTGPERLWFLEHPPLYTAGTSAKVEDLKAPIRFPVFKSPRGGQYTYHGPGQRVAYAMLDLTRRKADVRAFVGGLEAWIIDALDAFGVKGETRQDRVGVWVQRGRPGARREDKIAAIGVRVRRWITFHGLALNVEPDLEHFSGIVPCGIADPDFGVTSLVDLGLPVTMDEVDAALARSFERIFGAVVQDEAA